MYCERKYPNSPHKVHGLERDEDVPSDLTPDRFFFVDIMAPDVRFNAGGRILHSSVSSTQR